MRSHIIPELLWRAVYGPTGHTLAIDRDRPYISEVPKGLRERLLCSGCEKLFQRTEDYFARKWLGTQGLPLVMPPGVNVLRKEGLDYGTFMAFHLSIAWRASVSKHPAFREAQLGEYEQLVRRALLPGNGDELRRLRLYASVVLHPGSRAVVTAAMSPPATIVEEGRIRALAALYAGVQWVLVLPSEDKSVANDYSLQEDGSLVLHVVDMKDQLPGFYEFFRSNYDRAIIARDNLRRRHARKRDH